MNKIERIKELVSQLNIYRHEYYNLNKPSVSDAEYDSLFDELSSLEKETGFMLSNSPTQTVGYEVKSKLQKRQHPTPLKSLDKTKSIDELIKFKGNREIITMLKADGLTVELNYADGKFIGGYTRGNGETGEDITHNVKVFKNVPLTIAFKGTLRISGEAIIHWNDFNEINLNLSEDEKYKTPRNLVAGSVRQLESRLCAERNVYFYAFNILECNESFSDLKTEGFKFLNKLGFTVIPYIWQWKTGSIESDIRALKKWAEDIKIPIDGMVVSYNSISYSNSLGVTSHHPLHSLAYKFKDESETTILRDIEWSVGRTGVITPVAIFDTVILDGTEVSRASVHNLSIMEELELGIGDSISIIKANMIIPQIEENFTQSNNVAIPEKCPVCGGITIIDQDNESKFLYCTNENCSAKILKKFTHFVSRDAMNIEGLSEATLEKFIDIGWLETFDDIYRLQEHKSEIVRMEGFGLKSYNNLIEAIEKSKNVKMENFIYALGINQIGLGGAKRLAKYFNNDIDKFFDAIVLHHDFTKIEDFGEITAQSLREYFDNWINCEQIDNLLRYIILLQEEKKELASNLPLTGKKLYCTGTFAYGNKETLKTLVESFGGEFAGGYVKSLDYLVVGSLKGSGKEDKAKKDGVPILSEEEFLKMVEK